MIDPELKRLNQLTADYTSLMIEVRMRMEAINGLIDLAEGLNARVVRESCFLQVRMICELVALGCVVLHDSLPAAEVKKLRREYHPDKILAIISGYESGFFFPRAIERVTEVEPGHKHIEPVEPPVMTPADLRSIWGKTGPILHWGTVAKMHEPRDWAPDFEDVRELQKRFIALLQTHIVLTANETRPFVCEMYERRTGAVYVLAGGLRED